MLPKEKISNIQLIVLLTIITIGDSIIVLLYIPAKEARQDAWISGLISLLIGLLIMLFLNQFIRKNNFKSIIEINEKTLGKWIGGSLSLLYFFFLIMNMGAHVREMGITINTNVLSETPLLPIHILLIIVIVIAVRIGLETIVRTSEIFFPWVIGLIVLLSLALLPTMNLQQLLPIIDNGWKPIARGSITFIAFPFLEVVPLLFLAPHFPMEKLNKNILIGAGLGGIVLVIMMFLCITVLGAEMTSRQVYPAITLAKKIHLGEVIQRIEVLFGVVWILTTFFKITIYFYACCYGIAQLFKLSSYKPITFPLGIFVIFLSSTITSNLAQYHKVIERDWPFFDLTFCILFPLSLMFVGKMKSLNKKNVSG